MVNKECYSDEVIAKKNLVIFFHVNTNSQIQERTADVVTELISLILK